MSNYIQKVITYFFHHQVSDEIAHRVYKRMTTPVEDKERDKVIQDIWEELEEANCPDEQIAQAFQKIIPSYQPAPEVVKQNQIHWGKIAAMWILPLMMLCSSGYLFYQTNSSQKKLAEITYIQRYVPIGSREQVMLPDGSIVWLNAGSLLIYPSTFLSDNRDVYLSGEGFFQVKQDKEHPFIVGTNYLRLKVLGTTFNISAYPDNEQVRATLETGLLEVGIKDKTQSYRLNPNEQLVYTPATGTVECHKVQAMAYSDWRLGGLFFNNAPFDQVLSTLERTYGVKFQIQTSVYQNQRIRVHFNKNETLENVLMIIKVLIPGIKYEIDGKNIYLK